jgi:hypothetical protein
MALDRDSVAVRGGGASQARQYSGGEALKTNLKLVRLFEVASWLGLSGSFAFGLAKMP